jgi:7-carboxy-7-deazaguanine synthase
MTNKTKIKEIFTSIQGEGPHIGVKQLFIRFCDCNLNCDYCDTNANEDYIELTPEELKKEIENFDLKSIHSISLTGGEPLIWADFLLEFLPYLKLMKNAFNGKIYLETNSTLKDNLEKIIDYIDIISADIKLPSSSGIESSFAIHDEFFKVAKKYNKEIFAKIVFDENILTDEISHCLKLAEKYNLPLILQPKSIEDKVSVDKDKIFEVFNKFLAHYPNTKVIPQVHKFLGVM